MKDMIILAGWAVATIAVFWVYAITHSMTTKQYFTELGEVMADLFGMTKKCSEGRARSRKDGSQE